MTKTSPKGPYDNESDKRALSTNRRTGETPRAKLNNRLTSTIPKKVGVTGDRPILPDFHPPREPAALAQQLIPAVVKGRFVPKLHPRRRRRMRTDGEALSPCPLIPCGGARPRFPQTQARRKLQSKCAAFKFASVSCP